MKRKFEKNRKLFIRAYNKFTFFFSKFKVSGKTKLVYVEIYIFFVLFIQNLVVNNLELKLSFSNILIINSETSFDKNQTASL